MSALNRRILGIETEYGLTCVAADGTRRLTPDDAARYLFRDIVSRARSSNVFLINGSRLYLDVGSHPEYATCECDDLEQLITHERAGDLIMQQMAQDAERQLREEGIDGSLYLFKNNVDSAGNSYGCHENYLVARNREFAEMAQFLVPFFITRQLIVGAGKVVQTAVGTHYSVSQRADHMWDGVSSASTRSRPIINTRDEPHADAEEYRRLHVIVGDSSMSQTTQLLKVASTIAVLRFLEDRRTVRDCTLENPVRAIREIALDPDGRAPVRLANGQSTTALAIQWEFCNAVTEHAIDTGANIGSTARALDLWRRTLIAIESRRHADVGTEIDWIIKRTVLERAAERHSIDFSHPRIAKLDLAYHDINPARGLFLSMEARGLVATVIDPADAEAARSQPPQTTRAKLRGDFIRAALASGTEHTVDWTQLKISDHGNRSVMLKDPFSPVDARVDRLIASMAG